MERQNPSRPPDKKKARKNERDTEGGPGQLTTGTLPRDLFQQPQTLCFPTVNPKRCNPNGGGGLVDAGVFAAAVASSNAIDDLQNDCNTNTAKEGPQSSPFWIFGVLKFVTAT